MAPPTEQTRLRSAFARLRNSLAAARGGARRHPWRVAGIAAGLVVVALGIWLAVAALPDWEIFEKLNDRVSRKGDVAGLAREVREKPTKAAAQIALGHAEFKAKRRQSALRSYSRGLALDARAADSTLISNLIRCFGQKEQPAAERLIVKHKLTAAHDKLDALTRDKRSSVRWGAVETLQKLGLVSRSDYENAWMRDLDHPQCEVRQHAVKKLGEVGDRRTLQAVRAARKKDEAATPWYRSYCLKHEADQAEKRILARR